MVVFENVEKEVEDILLNNCLIYIINKSSEHRRRFLNEFHNSNEVVAEWYACLLLFWVQDLIVAGFNLGWGYLLDDNTYELE